MKLASILIFFIFLVSIRCSEKSSLASSTHCCTAKNSKTALTCKLMPEDLRLRKETVLESLKKKVLEKKELPNGYAFRFSGSDTIVDELVEFIKTERECCDFFIFNLSISGDKSEAWLELTGVEGAKDFVTQELGL